LLFCQESIVPKQTSLKSELLNNLFSNFCQEPIVKLLISKLSSSTKSVIKNV